MTETFIAAKPKPPAPSDPSPRDPEDPEIRRGPGRPRTIPPFRTETADPFSTMCEIVALLRTVHPVARRELVKTLNILIE